jgi:hypothetical protein
MKILVLDTETLGLFNPYVYDLGYLIYDTDGKKVLAKRDYIIKQVYDNEKYMKTAYYGWKKPLYEQMLADGQCKKVYWGVALDILRKDIARCIADGSELYAYNSRFDFNAIKETCKKYASKQNPTINGIKDIMDFIKPITQTEDYKRFCFENGFITAHKKPRPQQKAETLFRYLSGQTEFEEKHMALSDSEIELVILLKALGLDMC